MKIRVVVTDDHLVLLEGISRFIDMEEDMEVIGQATNGLIALSLVEKFKPDVVLMDINMPVMDGLKATQKIKEIAPNTQVLILTMSDEEEYFFPMIAAGASGYILKNSRSHEVVEAIRVVFKGDSMIHPSMAKKLLNRYTHSTTLGERIDSNVSSYNPLDRKEFVQRELTPRESEVLRYLIDGETNKEIGDRLFISDKTVKIHVNKIYKKINVKSRAQAIIYGVLNRINDVKKQ